MLSTSCYGILKILLNKIFLLTDAFNKLNLITAEAMGLIFFHYSTSLRPKRYLLVYRSMCNAFFMDLPVSSFVSHSFLLTAKGVEVVVACDGFPL